MCPEPAQVRREGSAPSGSEILPAVSTGGPVVMGTAVCPWADGKSLLYPPSRTQPPLFTGWMAQQVSIHT